VVIKLFKAALTCAFVIFFCGYSKAQVEDMVLNKKILSQIKKMTLEEKVGMLHANNLFSSAGVKRLGIPELISDDGPLGVREEIKLGWASANLKTDSATFFPNGSAIAATWNPVLAYDYGVALGEEAFARKKDIILAPAFNIVRTPLGGRTYEYYSEDPFLNAQLAVAAVKGIQSKHIAACIKHYALNNQETDRFKINVEVDERALQEIYLPAFKAAVKEGKAWAVMAAYNRFRGVYCSENKYLLNKLLKKQWGFKGLVMSDWGGTHSTVNAAKNGLDLEMGTEMPYEQYYFAEPLLAAVRKGKVSQKLLDEKVYRILWVLYHTSLYKNKPPGKINTSDHLLTAYNIASESIVLLKNTDKLLPLNIAAIKSIVVIGDNATRTFQSGGFGAGVKSRYEITALQGLKNKMANVVDLQYAQGYEANEKTIDSTRQNQSNPKLIKQAVKLASTSSVAIVFVGGNRSYETEGRDRKNLRLPFGVQELINDVSAVNKNTIVVVIGGAPYDLNEIKKNNNTIVWSWFNGSAGGAALADVLIGKVNPSGKLPFTFPVNMNDSPAFSLNPHQSNQPSTTYKEGILVGYRWFDTKKIEPQYPFGYGLSYSSYEYSALVTNKTMYKPGETVIITAKIKNSGIYGGKEVVQLYVAKGRSGVARPEKELKAFKKVWIEPGKTALIKLMVNVNDLAYFNQEKMQWVVETGQYNLLLASSSKDIREAKMISIGK